MSKKLYARVSVPVNVVISIETTEEESDEDTMKRAIKRVDEVRDNDGSGPDALKNHFNDDEDARIYNWNDQERAMKEASVDDVEEVDDEEED